MSTSAYYNFITASEKNSLAESPSSPPLRSMEAHRQAAMSPSSSSIATSSSNSNSSLYQFNSFTTQTSVASSSTESSSSSSSSASSTTSNHSSSHFHRNHNHRDLMRQSSVTPITSSQQQFEQQQAFHTSTLHSLEPKPLKPYKSNSEYLDAMREDLAEWLNRLYPDLDLTTENFFTQLETGSIICRHANNVTRMGRNLILEQVAASNCELAGCDSLPTSDQQTTIDYTSSTTNNSSPSLISNEQSHSSLASQYQSLNINGNNNNSLNSLKLDSRLAINWFQVKMIAFKQDAQPGTFLARDNICQFILWCRSINILECLLFETDDLVARKNERSFILCLLEVARIGFKVGMPTPLIIQLEHEIDREIENEARLQREKLAEEDEEQEKKNQDDTTIDSYITDEDSINQQSSNELDNQIKPQEDVAEEKKEIQDEKSEEEKDVEEDEQKDSGPRPQVITNDLLSLHEKVVQLLCLCTCPTQFPMVRVGENGKYKVGDKLIIFVRILRRHIMVRVGGGWQELSEFLRVKDPCRSKSPSSGASSAHHNYHHHNNHHQPAKLALNTRSRLVESSHHLNKGYQNSRNSSAGQRLISGSASMSWLSHNS